MPKKLVKFAFFSALGETVYILLIALFVIYSGRFKGNEPSILPIIVFLLTFVFSAALSGALILGKPILLYLEGKKKEAITLFGLTLGWLMLFLIIALSIAAIRS
jgi:hypothetical protein